MGERFFATSAAVGLVVVLIGGCGSGSSGDRVSPTTSSAPTTTTTAALVPPATPDGIRLSTTTTPAGFDVAGARWIEINRPDGRTQLAAVFVPDGTGPFPTVVFLHGSSGLGLVQLQWAPRLAAAGYLVLAGCYLAANAARAAVDPTAFVPCAGLTPNDLSDGTAIANGYRALVSTARALGAARPGPIGIVGVSFGAGVALNAEDPAVTAIVADSGHGTGPVSAVDAPVLILGGTADAMVPHADVVAYEQALRAAGKTVESHYYDGAGHVVTLINATTDDATRRVVTFLDRHLK
jgi:dienelactone hydrolase